MSKQEILTPEEGLTNTYGPEIANEKTVASEETEAINQLKGEIRDIEKTVTNTTEADKQISAKEAEIRTLENIAAKNKGYETSVNFDDLKETLVLQSGVGGLIGQDGQPIKNGMEIVNLIDEAKRADTPESQAEILQKIPALDGLRKAVEKLLQKENKIAQLRAEIKTSAEQQKPTPEEKLSSEFPEQFTEEGIAALLEPMKIPGVTGTEKPSVWTKAKDYLNVSKDVDKNLVYEKDWRAAQKDNTEKTLGVLSKGWQQFKNYFNVEKDLDPNLVSEKDWRSQEKNKLTAKRHEAILPKKEKMFENDIRHAKNLSGLIAILNQVDRIRISKGYNPSSAMIEDILNGNFSHENTRTTITRNFGLRAKAEELFRKASKTEIANLRAKFLHKLEDISPEDKKLTPAEKLQEIDRVLKAINIKAGSSAEMRQKITPAEISLLTKQLDQLTAKYKSDPDESVRNSLAARVANARDNISFLPQAKMNQEAVNENLEEAA